MADVTVVLMTRDRVEELLETLARLRALPENPPIIVVDNGSTDGTSAAVTQRFPDVQLVSLPDNEGVEARNIGVRRAGTPYVAFNDDDSWWAPGALAEAVRLFEEHPRLGAITADVVVEPGGRRDPTSQEMRDSPLEGDPGLPGIPVLGFLACATVVRREAYVGVGGFSPRLHFGGEEMLLATDLTASGWAVRYMDHLTVHHLPSKKRDDVWRRRREVRNTLWVLWLRRPAGSALRRSWQLVRRAAPDARAGLGEALRGLPWVLRSRRVVSPALERQLRQLETAPARSARRQPAP